MDFFEAEMARRFVVAVEKIANALDRKTEPYEDEFDVCDSRNGCVGCEYHICKLEQTEPNSSEKPNNCEHITEDGVTCAKYPACDDCLDNPLNKVKGSERLLKGSEQTDCQWK